MSRIANLLTLSLIAALALSWGWVLTTAFAGESNPDAAGRNQAWSVQGQSDAPHIFIGRATINGIPAWAGSTVTAWDTGSNRLIGSATTRAGGNFILSVDRSSGPIGFRVNGLNANETHPSWEFGRRTDNFALTVTDPNFLESAGVTSNPSQVVANQRVTLSGNGFKAGTTINAIHIGGKAIPADRINDGGSVAVDDSGRWSATVDLPLNSATTAEGRVAIQATDSAGAYGRGETTIQARRVTIDPPFSRIGTTATVRGTGFPSRNDEGSSFIVQIAYAPGSGWETNLSTVSDASGRFQTQIRIPTSAAIPSTNIVKAEFDDDDYVVVTAITTHSVPPASIALSATSGAPGTEVNIKVEGAKAFVPVTRVLVGNVDVAPSPSPSTNALGISEFNIRIPNLYPGSFTVEVQMAGSNASTTFTVTTQPTATPVPTPTPTPVPTATPRPTPTATPWPTPAPTATAATPMPTPAAPQLIIPGNEPPHLFIGRAALNGNAVGAGVSVQAYDGSKLIGATVTQAGGTFTIHVHRSAGVITFRVNNQAAAESWASWASGQANHGFNLTAGSNRVEDNPSRLFAALPDLVRAFTFDNATKGWNFFDPLAAEVSTLTRFMPQHSYWLLVSRTTWLMLNGVERQLTCVEENCWNLIVW